MPVSILRPFIRQSYLEKCLKKVESDQMFICRSYVSTFYSTTNTLMCYSLSLSLAHNLSLYLFSLSSLSLFLFLYICFCVFFLLLSRSYFVYSVFIISFFFILSLFFIFFTSFFSLVSFSIICHFFYSSIFRQLFPSYSNIFCVKRTLIQVKSVV